MIDLLNRAYCPTVEEIADFIRNPVFDSFRARLESLGAKAAPSYSSCSWMPGWNVKFKKGSKSVCTVYPREGFFTVLVVIGPGEREAAEAMLPGCTDTMQQIYRETKEGSGQRWLMIDLEDPDELLWDTLKMIDLRILRKKKNFVK